MSVEDLYGAILDPTPAPTVTGVGDVLALIEASALPLPWSGLVVASKVDRLGYAFAAGYTMAMRRLASRWMPEEPWRMCLAATESGGAHPRAIHTSLKTDGDGYLLSGSKMWVTLAMDATHLLVLAAQGEQDNRPRIRAVIVPVQRTGVSRIPMPDASFCPEVKHATLELSEVRIRPHEVLDVDGFADVLRPFRTIEDLAIQAALCAWMTGVSRRLALDKTLSSRGLALLSATQELWERPPSSAAVHIALGGLFDASAALVEAFREGLKGLRTSAAATEVGERFERDRPLLGIAGRVREQRLQKAWEVVSRGSTSEAGRADS